MTKTLKNRILLPSVSTLLSPIVDTDYQIANTNQNKGFEIKRFLTRQNAAGDAPSDVNVIIPLNRYSCFEELEDKMLVPMQLQFTIELQNQMMN